MFIARPARAADKNKILSLYRKVANRSGGIARSEEEITEDYIQHFIDQATLTGIELVVDHPGHQDVIIAEIHGYKLVPKVFSHVLSELTIAVDPDFHGQGVGKLIFTCFLEYITTNRPDILRVELITQESNTRALNLYEKVGFVVEGRLEKRIAMYGDQLDADIPLAWFNKNFIKQ
jgi:ribosomal protein S18 acetylase RimI-like enzyme